MTALLGVSDISAVFHRRPLLLDSAEVAEALADLTAAVPAGYDARRMLLAMPSLLYAPNREQVRQWQGTMWEAKP